MSAFELVLIVTIGDLVQQGVTQEDMSVTGRDARGRHDRGARRGDVLRRVPVAGLETRDRRRAGGRGRRGEIVDEAIAIERLTRDEVISSAREQGIDDLATCGSPCWSPTARSRSCAEDDREVHASPTNRPAEAASDTPSSRAEAEHPVALGSVSPRNGARTSAATSTSRATSTCLSAAWNGMPASSVAQPAHLLVGGRAPVVHERCRDLGERRGQAAHAARPRRPRVLRAPAAPNR